MNAGCGSHGDDPATAGGTGGETTGAGGGAGGSGGTPAVSSGGTPEASCPADPFSLAPPDVVAARLAGFLWQEQPPSRSLEDRAAAARTPEAVRELTLEMLQDPRARAGVSAFFSSWLRLGDLPALTKTGVVVDPELVASMQKEAPAFGTSVVLDGDGLYETLMTADHTFMDETLASHYGVSGVTGPELRQVAFDRPERVGILMGAGALTRFSGELNPPWAPRRFWLTHETLLCDQSRIPAALGTVPRDSDAYSTIRGELESRTARDDCHLCHASVNPIGLAFSAFDTLGRFNAVDEVGMPVVTAGTVPAGLAWYRELTISDAGDLIRQLVSEPRVRRCFAARWLDYALEPGPRPVDLEVDVLGSDLQCSLSLAHSAFEAAGGDIQALIAAVAATPAFLSPEPR